MVQAWWLAVTALALVALAACVLVLRRRARGASAEEARPGSEERRRESHVRAETARLKEIRERVNADDDAWAPRAGDPR